MTLPRSIEAGHEIRLVVVERGDAISKKEGGGSFAPGRSYGEVLGAVEAPRVPLKILPPTTWRKVVLAGTARDKQAALAYAGRRFPGAWHLATARTTWPHVGIADSLCLAEWGRRLVAGTVPGS